MGKIWIWIVDNQGIIHVENQRSQVYPANTGWYLVAASTRQLRSFSRH